MVRQTTVGACPPVTVPERDSQGEQSVSPEKEGPSHTVTQTPLMPPVPDPPKTPLPGVPPGSPGVLRRSQRIRKPPDRLYV